MHTKELGVNVSKKELDELKDLGDKIKHYIEARVEVKHPDEDIEGIYGVIFSDNPHSNQADFRNVTIFADKQIDRSPCGSGTAARVATLYEREELKMGGRFVHEAITDEHFTGEIQSLCKVDKYNAVIPKVTGSAHITGFHQFVISPYDSLNKGFLLK